MVERFKRLNYNIRNARRLQHRERKSRRKKRQRGWPEGRREALGENLNVASASNGEFGLFVKGWNGRGRCLEEKQEIDGYRRK
jgi:hypothetical protein